MIIEWISDRGFRRCTIEKPLALAKIEFSGRAPYVEYSDGKTTSFTLHSAINPLLRPMFAVQLRRERL